VGTLPGVYLLIIGVGYFFTFFDIADIGYAMPAISKQFPAVQRREHVAVAAGLIGYAAGSMLIGSLSDRFGRFRLMLITIGITAVGSFLDATATGRTASQCQSRLYMCTLRGRIVSSRRRRRCIKIQPTRCPPGCSWDRYAASDVRSS
jgi:MFS family permease